MPKKRADGRYEIKVKVSRAGEPRKYKAVYGTTLREAQAKAKKLEAEAAAGVDISVQPTVTEVIDYWLDLKKPTVRETSFRSYYQSLKYAKEYFGNKLIKDITIDDARGLYRSVFAVHPSQANQCRGRMRSVCADAVVRGLIQKNPFDGTKRITIEKDEKRRLTQEELEKIEAAFPRLIPFDRTLLAVLRYTGMRKGEALGLSVEDVDFEKRTISITKSAYDGKVGPTKTKAGMRTVPMPDALVDVLRDYLDHYYIGHPYRQYGMDVPLFPNRNMTYLSGSSFQVHWKNIKKVVFGEDAPKDFTPHLFRHNYASELVINHIPPTTAMLVLGHESFETTMDIYTHFGYKDIDSDAILAIYGSSSNRSSKA